MRAIRMGETIDVWCQVLVTAGLRLGNGGFRRKDEANGGPATERALRGDLAAVRFDEVLHDGEAETGASLLAGAAGIDAVEPLEDAGEVLGGDSGAVVGDRDGYRAVVARGRLDRDRHATATRHVAQGVVVEV